MEAATEIQRSPGHSQQESTIAGPDPQCRRDPLDRLIVALDFPSAEAAIDMVDQLQGTCRWFKVGMELYYAAGNSVIERLRERGVDIELAVAQSGSQTAFFVPYASCLSVAMPAEGIHTRRARIPLAAITRCQEILVEIARLLLD